MVDATVPLAIVLSGLGAVFLVSWATASAYPAGYQAVERQAPSARRVCFGSGLAFSLLSILVLGLYVFPVILPTPVSVTVDTDSVNRLVSESNSDELYALVQTIVTTIETSRRRSDGGRSVRVTASELDTRGLASTTDSVLVKGSDGSNHQTLRTDTSGNVVVTATELDTRNLTAANDAVLIKGTDGSTTRTLRTDASGNVVVTATELDTRNLTAANDAVLIKGTDGSTTRTLRTDTEGNLQTHIVSPLTAFGELRTEVAIPAVQLTFQHGIHNGLTYNNVKETGSVATSGNMVELSTGTDPAGAAFLRSTNYVKYRAGEGILSRFTAVWPEGCSAGMESVIGPGDEANGFFFGCNGPTFGVLRRSGGVQEIRSIDVTGGPVSGDGTIDIVLNGETAVNVDIANGDTAEEVASKIAETDFSSTGDGWTAYAVDAKAYLIYNSVGDLTGSMTVGFTTSTNIAASNNEISPGVLPIDTWFNQTEWNVDPGNGNGPSGLNIDPTLGNVFQIQYAWLGFGAVHFMAVTPSGRLDIVHTIHYSNTASVTSIERPSNPIGVIIKNKGSTTASTIKSPSIAVFLEGPIVVLSQLKSRTGTIANPDTTNDPNEVLVLQNNRVFNGVKSTIEVIVTRITFTYAGSTNADCTFYVRLNPSADFLFNSVEGSPVSYSSTTTNEHTGGTLVYSTTLSGDTSSSDRFDYGDITLRSGDILAVSVEASSSNTASVSIAWKEDD